MDIIIGAGVSGLSYAMFHGGDYLVLEKDDTLGGYCRTTRRNGYVWDYSGHFFHFQDKHIKELIMADLAPDATVCVDKCTHIKYHDRLIDFPFQKNIHQLDKEEFIDCLVDLFQSGNNNYRSFKEMLYAKFGKSIAEKFLIPYNTKLYATDLNNLDNDAMGRFFPYAEKEEIVRNFRQTANTSYNGSFVYPREGAIVYIDRILSHLDRQKIRTSCRVSAIDTKAKEVILSDGQHMHYDRLISTMPFVKLLDIAGIPYDPVVYGWNQVLVFNIGFDCKGTNTSDHWLYLPGKEYCFYRVGFYDNILGNDRMSLYVELGFDKNAEINPDEWLPRVLADLKLAGIVANGQKIVDYESIIMNPAYVHISEASRRDVAEKKAQLAEMDIYSIGRYGSWTYCSIEDNIKEARDLIIEKFKDLSTATSHLKRGYDS